MDHLQQHRQQHPERPVLFPGADAAMQQGLLLVVDDVSGAAASSTRTSSSFMLDGGTGIAAAAAAAPLSPNLLYPHWDHHAAHQQHQRQSFGHDRDGPVHEPIANSVPTSRRDAGGTASTKKKKMPPQVPATNAMTATNTAEEVATGQQVRKKRYCLFPGCTRAVKSQGHCQRHGAVAKRCKVLGCHRQAQGKHDGMCKRHYRENHKPPPPAEAPDPPPGDGTSDPPKKVRNVKSVYESVLPNSITWAPLRSRPVMKAAAATKTTTTAAVAAAAAAAKGGDADVDAAQLVTDDAAVSATSNDHQRDDNVDADAACRTEDVMPLILHLRKGRKRSPGWHRRDERIAAGANPLPVKSQLEPWERRLALVEILLLSGGTPGADFRDLAHAWGREKGFHQHLSATMCERRGDVERKVRSDRGKDKKRAAAVELASTDALALPMNSDELDGGGGGGDGVNVDPASHRPAKRPYRSSEGFPNLLARDGLGV